jgi:putative hydroxymethylpyrimidine transport system substrate-binding protein
VVWPVDTLGAPRYHSYLLGTQEAVLKRNPVLVRSVLAIVRRGYLTARDDPGTALTALERYVPYFPRAVLQRSLELITPTWFHQDRWGCVQPELVRQYAVWLAANEVLPGADGWQHAFTNDYLPTS